MFLMLETSSFSENPFTLTKLSVYLSIVTHKTCRKTYISPPITLFDCRMARPVTIFMRRTQCSTTPQMLWYSTKIIVTAQSHPLPAAIAASEWKGLFFPSKVNTCNVIRNWKISEKNGLLDLLWSILTIILRSGTSHLLSFVFVSSGGSRLYTLDFLHVLFSCWSFPFTCTWIFAELANLLLFRFPLSYISFSKVVVFVMIELILVHSSRCSSCLGLLISV